MSDEIAVSVIIPAYNAERFIVGTVRSALSQSIKDIEVIVVDDGSTDNTASYVEQIQQEDNRLSLYSQENMGVGRARESGRLRSRGRYIAILDADDIWHPRKLEMQLSCESIERDDYGLVYCRYREIDTNGDVVGSPLLRCVDEWVYPDLLLANFIGGGSAALIKREALEDIGGFPSCRINGAEDTKLFLAIAEKYKFCFVDAFLMGYRLSDQSMSKNYMKMAESMKEVLQIVAERHPHLPNFVIKWALSECLEWLFCSAVEDGRFGASLRLLLHCIRNDPMSIVKPHVSTNILRTVFLLDAWRSKPKAVPRRRHFLDYLPTEEIGKPQPPFDKRHEVVRSLFYNNERNRDAQQARIDP